MASSQDLSTPQCSAEQRAWLLVYQKRLGLGIPLVEAFNKQFPEREHREILLHASHVGRSKSDVQSQLQDLAEQFPWYGDPPQEGEVGYARMKRLERQKEARNRQRQTKTKTDLERTTERVEQNVRADTDNDETTGHSNSGSQETEAARATLAGTSTAPKRED